MLVDSNTSLYLNLIKSYGHNASKELLQKAGELGKRFVKKGITPDQVIQMHIQYAETVFGESEPVLAIATMRSASEFLLRVMSEYSNAYTQFKLKDASRISNLDKANKELKKSNNELALLLDFSANLNKINSIKGLAAVTKETLSKLLEVERLEISLDENKVLKSDDSLLMPIMFSGEKYATLILKGKQIGVFLTEHRQFIQMVLNQLSVTIERLNLYEELKILSITDSKTSLYNFKYYSDCIEDEIRIAKENNTQVALLMMDIDNFKVYNDCCGHDMGDLVMCQIGEVLRKEMEETGIAARFGGEEFTVIVPNATKKAAMEIAEKIRNRIKQTVEVHSNFPYPYLSVSVGVSILPENGKTRAELVRAADAALYAAKAAGKDRVVCAYEIEFRPVNN